MQNEVLLAYRKLFRDIVYDPAEKADAYISYVITKAGKEKIMDKIIRYNIDLENVKTNKIEWDSWDLK